MNYKKQHWYGYTFADNIGMNTIGYKSTFMGYDVKDKITPKLIQEASNFAKCQNKPNLIACIYLGYMSESEFTEDWERGDN